MQVGGNHYQNERGIDVFDIADAFDLEAREFTAVKYILRHHKKNHSQDICKAIHCLIRVLTDVYNIQVPEDASVEDLLRAWENK